MYYNSSATVAAPSTSEAPVRARLQLADLLNFPGSANNSDVFATVPGQPKSLPTLLTGASVARPAHAAKTYNAGIPSKASGGTMDAAQRCLQHGPGTYDPQVPKLGQLEPHAMPPGQPMTSISMPAEQMLQVHAVQFSSSTLPPPKPRLHCGSAGSRCQEETNANNMVQGDEVLVPAQQNLKHGKHKTKDSSCRRVLPPGRVQELDATPIPSKQETPVIVPPLSAEDVAHSFADDITTVMLRNVPLRYITEELLHEFIAAGFEGKFDFFYLPIDFRTKRNRGYCFVNFTCASYTKDFVHDFHGRHLARYSTKKILEVAPADTQGLEANAKKYVSQRVSNPWFRPMFFGDAGDADDME